MLYPAARPNQIIPNFIPHDDVSSNNGNRGETSPSVRNMLNGQYGRNLSGLGRSEYGGDAEFDDNKLESLEDQDDVVGSGIFDEAGSGDTINPELGVFADHPNLPGYIAREVQFEPNHDIEELATGGDVIAVPGGGMTWGGRLIGPGTTTPQLPYRYQTQMTPSPSMVSSVKMSGPSSRVSIPTPVAPVNTASRFVPMPRPRSLAPRTCGCNAPLPVPPAQRRAGMKGFGAEEPVKESPSMLPYIAGGILTGAAIWFVLGTLAIKSPVGQR